MERKIRILFKSPLVSMLCIEICQRFRGSAPITHRIVCIFTTIPDFSGEILPNVFSKNHTLTVLVNIQVGNNLNYLRWSFKGSDVKSYGLCNIRII